MERYTRNAGHYMAPHHWILMARYFTEQKDESEAVTAIKSFSQFRSLSNPNAEPHHARAYKFDVVSFPYALRRKKNFNRSYG